MKLLKFYALLILLISSSHLFATTYTANANGDWTTASTWSPSGVPGVGDNVVIDGYDITHSSGTISVDQISFTNISNVGESILRIKSSGKIIVKNDVTIESENVNYDVRIIVSNFGELEVGGHMIFERKITNTHNTRCALHILNNGKVSITGNYIYNHRNGGESYSELWLESDGMLDVNGNFITEKSGSGSGKLASNLIDNAQINVLGNLESSLLGGEIILFSIIEQGSFSVAGNMTLSNSGGTDKINVMVGDNLDAATFSVGGNLNLISTNSNKLIEVDGNSASTINVTGDISFSPVSEATAKVTLTSTSTLNLGGTILRPNNYGVLDLGSDATLNLNGSQPQVLAPNKLAGSGTDSLYYSNVLFNNSSGSPTTLGGPLVIDNHLAMDDGIIISSASSPLVLADNATIGSGNSNAFIDGPIIKKGRTAGSSLTFPTGKGSTYAPMSISEVTNINGEVTVEYYSDPPPFGYLGLSEAGIESVSKPGWSIEKNNSAGDLNYTLNWTDAEALGINDLSSLVVAGYDNTSWDNYGQQSTTGGTGSGIAGSITNAYSDPPPFGVIFFTFGTTSALNKLPIELSKFIAYPKGKSAELIWQTETEVAFSHFEIERSVEGRDFETLTKIEGTGGNNLIAEYSYNDRLPFDGMNYYRLKIVDLDGSFEYSNIEAVNFKEEKEFEIYPNPVTDLIQIQGEGRENEAMLFQVFDKTGRQVYESWINFEGGYFQISSNEINISSTGIYLIKISSSVKSQEFKIIKIE